MIRTWALIGCLLLLVSTGAGLPTMGGAGVGEECRDSQDYCIKWAAQGYCDKGSVYRPWMVENCRRSCKQCTPTPADICKGPINKDFKLVKVEYDQDKQQLSTTRHDVAQVTVSDGGSGSMSASGSNVQSAKFTSSTGVRILDSLPLKMVVPQVSDDGTPSISTSTSDLVYGNPNWSYSNYQGTWPCYSTSGETKTCVAYVNQFKLETPYKITWQAPGGECYAESSGVLVQELWGQPIVRN